MLKKAGPFKYKKMKALPADSEPFNTRFYLFTDQGNFWCPPFETKWQTFPEEMEQCFEINNVYCVRLDLEIAARCPLNNPVDIDIGELIAFKFDIPLLSWKQPERSAGPKGDTRFRRSPRQSWAGIRWVSGQDGKLSVRGFSRVSRVTDDKKRGHSVAQLLPQARPSGKALPVRSTEDEDADSGD